MNIPNPAKLKLALVSPKGPLYRHRGGIFRQHLRYAPLTLTTLAALVPSDIPADVEILDEGVGDLCPEGIGPADELGVFGRHDYPPCLLALRTNVHPYNRLVEIRRLGETGDPRALSGLERVV